MTGPVRKKVKPSIRFYLVAIVVALVIPIAALVALLLLQLEAWQRSALEERVVGYAHTIAAGAGRKLQDMATTLKVLASSPELEDGDLEKFHRRIQNALSASDFFVIAVRSDGQQLLNTRVPFGTALGKTSNIPHLKSVLAAGRVEVSDVFLGRTSGRRVFNVTSPVETSSASEVVALIMTENADDFGSQFSTEGLPAGWLAAVVDQNGNVVAISTRPGEARSDKISVDLTVPMPGLRGIAANDAKTLVAYSKVPGWPWKVVTWGPTASAEAPIADAWLWLMLGGFLLVFLALGGAIALSQRLRRSIVSIAEMAERLGKGDIVAPADTAILEGDMVARALSEASFDRSEAEDRMGLVQRELIHRTKNLLAVVQSILNQTARHSENLPDFRTAVSQRLEGLARSIDLLTAGDWSGVPMRKVVEAQLSTFVDVPSRREIHGEDFLLKPEAVQNLGLALHELATNAVKYGSLSNTTGKVVVEWAEDHSVPGEPVMTISWTEVGGPPVSEPGGEGFGTTVLERATAAAFRGTVEAQYAPAGFRWSLRAPIDELRQKFEPSARPKSGRPEMARELEP